jgi:hypothetical protein
LQNIPNLSNMWKCGLDISVTTALKNDLFSGFFFILVWFYPNQQLICLQNIPNLSTMWKCGLDMSVTTALKNDLFSVFFFHIGVVLSKPTTNMFAKEFLIYQPCEHVFSTCQWQLLWKMTYLVFFSFILAWFYPNQQLICLQKNS